MNDETSPPARPRKLPLADTVGAKAARKLHARRHAARTVWFGFGMMGLIGWSVAIPTLAGAALGIWLDRYHPGDRSWTLALLVAGLAFGCANAWHWVSKENEAIQEERQEEREEERRDGDD